MGRADSSLGLAGVRAGGPAVIPLASTAVAVAYLYGLRRGLRAGVEQGRDQFIRWSLEHGAMPDGWREQLGVE